MKFISLLLLFFSASLFANEEPKMCCLVKEKVKETPPPPPKVIYRTNTVEKPVFIPVPQAPAPVVKEEKCCEKTPDTTVHKSTTGNQKVIVNIPQPKPNVIVREKIKVQVKRKVVVKRSKVVIDKPNRIQLYLGVSNTDHSVYKDDCCNVDVRSRPEADVGLQYLRDFGSFTGSVMGTKNGNFGLGLGLNW